MRGGLTRTLMLITAPLFVEGQTEANFDSLVSTQLDPTEVVQDFSTMDELIRQYSLPLNVNQLDPANPLTSALFSMAQSRALSKHIRKYGPLQSVYELQMIPGFDEDDLNRLLPYVSTGPFRSPRGEWTGFVSFTTGRVIPKQEGFKKTYIRGFLGDPMRHIVQAQLHAGNSLRLGITLEKDRGEKTRWKPGEGWFGFDHLSGYVAYEGLGNVRQVVVGTLLATWGQGLVMGSGFHMRPGRNATGTVKKPSSGLIPTQTLSEANYLQGIGIVLEQGPIQLSLIGTHHQLDASIDVNGTISTIRSSGLHRTEGEVQARNKARVNDVAAKLEFLPTQNFRLGVIGMRTLFDHPYEKILKSQGSSPANVTTLGSVFFELRPKNIVLFGEGSLNQSREHAWLVGALISFNKEFTGLIALRDYSRQFFSFRSYNAFGQSSTPRNESGTYWGLKFQPNKRISFDASLDLFRKPLNLEAKELDRKGIEYALASTFEVSKKVRARFLFRSWGVDETMKPDSVPTLVIERSKRYQLKTDARIQTDHNVTFVSGVGYGWQDGQARTSMGSIFHQDIIWRSQRLQVSTRMALVDADYANRFYLFERDLYRTTSVPVHSGKAIKYFVVLRNTFGRNLTISAKWTRTHYHDRDVIGSGPDKIVGTSRSEIKANVFLAF